MISIAAKEAKNNFGEMMDTVQREPVTIEKHGRPVAVVMSAREYREMKLERLKVEVKKGTDELDRGEGTDGETFFKELLDK